MDGYSLSRLMAGPFERQGALKDVTGPALGGAIPRSWPDPAQSAGVAPEVREQLRGTKFLVLGNLIAVGPWISLGPPGISSALTLAIPRRESGL